jgi:hypothetical protein
MAQNSVATVTWHIGFVHPCICILGTGHHPVFMGLGSNVKYKKCVITVTAKKRTNSQNVTLYL